MVRHLEFHEYENLFDIRPRNVKMRRTALHHRQRDTSTNSLTSEDSYNYVGLGPECDEFVFQPTSNMENIMNGMNLLRMNNQFCDVTLIVDGTSFQAHRNVLSSFSPYFNAMFTGGCVESKEGTVYIGGVDADTMRSLLDFAYTSNIKITKRNCQSLLAAANLLQILSVQDAACAFLAKQMSVSNCIGIYSFADTHSCTKLQNIAKRFILRYFQEVVQKEEYLKLPAAKLIEIISEDQLHVPNEEFVFDAVSTWYNEDSEVRQADFHKVLEKVRLPLISPSFLHDCVEPFPAVRTNPLSMELLNEAKWYHLLPSRRFEMSSPRTRRRETTRLLEVIVAVGGEDDKVVLRSVEGFHPVTMSWYTFSTLPFAISKHGLVSSGRNCLYVAGGEYPDGKISDGFWRYDPILDCWQEMAPLLTPRAELSIVEIDDYIYVAGGWDGRKKLNTLDYYDPFTNLWTPMVYTMREHATNPSLISYSGKLYIIEPAQEDPRTIPSMQVLNPRTGSWSDLPVIPTPRNGASVCLLNGFIYVMGGWAHFTEDRNQVDRYDIENEKWENVTPMLMHRIRAGACAFDGKIYVIGGEESHERYHDSVECYDPSKNTWATSGNLLSPRSWLGCSTLQVTMFSCIR